MPPTGGREKDGLALAPGQPAERSGAGSASKVFLITSAPNGAVAMRLLWPTASQTPAIFLLRR